MKSEKVSKTYDDFRAAILKEFPDTLNYKEMHEMMSARKKKKDESFYEYILIMKELGKGATFPIMSPYSMSWMESLNGQTRIK